MKIRFEKFKRIVLESIMNENNLPITDMGDILRLNTCQKQKNMSFGYDGFIFVHKDVNPEISDKKPYLMLIHQIDSDDGTDYGWQIHFHNFINGETTPKIYDDLYKALEKTCKSGMELHSASFTPGGISGYNKLSKYGFKKIWLPNNTYSYWSTSSDHGGDLILSKLEEWLNNGKHLDEFLVKNENGEFILPKQSNEKKFSYENTIPRPFKMVKI